MAVYSFIYFMFGIALLARPARILELINEITEAAGGSPLDIPADPFWSTISVSLLMLLALMCALAYWDIDTNSNLVWLMIFAKYVSASAQLAYFAFSAQNPLGFLIGAMVDGTLGTFAVIFAVRYTPALERLKCLRARRNHSS